MTAASDTAGAELAELLAEPPIKAPAGEIYRDVLYVRGEVEALARQLAAQR